ncbi:MAG: hypothetical protein GKR95_05430 [Gammaproteobacteria bacterium]|nr:hypothetical protein [Gammaproteobacteria bacterium]
MLFPSYQFLSIFLPAFLIAYFICIRFKSNLGILLILCASAVFYWVSSLMHLLLLITSIFFNFSLSNKITESGTAKSKKALLVIGLAFNLLLIAYFKYTNFLVENIAWISGSNLSHFEILLPLGISFFTFQQIAYLIDVYEGKSSQYSFTEYATFVSFFPQLIAGPIVHHKQFISQIRGTRFLHFDLGNIIIGFSIFTIGLFKKVAIADGFSVIANKVFGAAEQGIQLTFADAWLGAIAYTFQIYFDFSGYGDMALGLAILIGLWLPINFNSPYKATSIIEFWQRWHITLSSFLKNYLYIPLGGNRGTPLGKYRNLVIVMLLGGLWHGSSWNFVIWVDCMVASS